MIRSGTGAAPPSQLAFVYNVAAHETNAIKPGYSMKAEVQNKRYKAGLLICINTTLRALHVQLQPINYSYNL